MFSLRGSRKRKTEEIIKKFLKSYAENEKSQDKKNLKTWLISELQNELPNKKVEDIEKIATELITGIEIYYKKKKEVENLELLMAREILIQNNMSVTDLAELLNSENR